MMSEASEGDLDLGDLDRRRIEHVSELNARMESWKSLWRSEEFSILMLISNNL